MDAWLTDGVLATAGEAVALESTTMAQAFLMSAPRSTYTWQMPSAWPSTGIFVFCWMCVTCGVRGSDHVSGQPS